jgi:hypothetical protein
MAAFLGIAAGLYAEDGSHSKHTQAKLKTAVQESEIGKINTQALKTVLDAKAPLLILDARSGKYDDRRHIPGAKTLNAKSSQKEIENTIPTKDTLIGSLLHQCRVPCQSQAH